MALVGNDVKKNLKPSGEAVQEDVKQTIHQAVQKPLKVQDLQRFCSSSQNRRWTHRTTSLRLPSVMMRLRLQCCDGDVRRFRAFCLSRRHTLPLRDLITLTLSPVFFFVRKKTRFCFLRSLWPLSRASRRPLVAH